MRRFEIAVALCMLLSAGCVATPSEFVSTDKPQAVLGSDTAAAQATAPQSELEAVAIPASALDDRGQLICRDTLKAGSNVIVRRCFTQEDWRRYKRQQTVQAQQTLRAMQGGGFR